MVHHNPLILFTFVEDIKQFVVDYPQFKQLMSNMSKHMKLMQEIQYQVSKRELLDVSQVEQSLACHEDILGAQKSMGTPTHRIKDS